MNKSRRSANLVSKNNIFSNITNNRVGIGTTVPQYNLDVLGDINLTGTFRQNGSAFVASSVASNSVGLGTHTYGDYVKDITGTANQITVTSGTGEGSSPTLSVPNQFTAPQDVTITRDLQVDRNLNVNGNITIGGTSATLFTTELKVYDADLVLGFRTDGSGNDISTDNTANHGGIAVASTEGTPLISLYDVGIGETNLATYKKIMWFKSGTFAGLGTDAWISNYAIGIGSTQVPNGVRLAAGGIQVSDSTLSVPQLNISGVSTFTTGPILIGTATSTGTSSQRLQVTGGGYFSGNVGIGTTNPTSSKLFVDGDTKITGILTVGTSSIIIDGTGNVINVGAGVTIHYLDGVQVGQNVMHSSGITLNNINSSGVSTFTTGPILIGTATSTRTASQRLQVTGGAYVSGNLGVGITNPTEKLHVVGVVSATSYRGDGSQLTGVGGAAAVTVLTSNTTLSKGTAYMLNASDLTLTLPASPSTGDAIDILNNVSGTHTIARNGSTIQGLTEDMQVSQQGIKFKIWYTGSTWSLF